MKIELSDNVVHFTSLNCIFVVLVKMQIYCVYAGTASSQVIGCEGSCVDAWLSMSADFAVFSVSYSSHCICIF